jgi:transketolase
LRFGKKVMPFLPRANSSFELGRASLIRDGEDLSFLASGETVAPALEAAELLAAEGIDCRVLSFHTIKPLDEPAVLRAANETGCLITVEEHSVSGGLGEACASLLLQRGRAVRFQVVGFPDEYTMTGSQVELFRHYGISGSGLAKTARRLRTNKSQ